MYPEESIQFLFDDTPWWVIDESKTYTRGRLCYAYIPHVVQTPLTLVATRAQPTVHDEIEASIEQIRIGSSRRLNTLPLAALPTREGELYTVYLAKKRPCVIVGDGWEDLPSQMQRGRPTWQKSPVVMVAPYYGVGQDGSRAGFPPEFVERVRHCMYPQFFYDILPHNRKESLLIFPHMQPVGRHHDSIQLTEHRLSPFALSILDEWVNWSLCGCLPEEGQILKTRDFFLG